jgi:hypothetical protein
VSRKLIEPYSEGEKKNMQRAFLAGRHTTTTTCVYVCRLSLWLYHSPSEVARSLPPECVEKGLNGAGECVVSEIDLVIFMCESECNDRGDGEAEKRFGQARLATRGVVVPLLSITKTYLQTLCSLIWAESGFC